MFKRLICKHVYELERWHFSRGVNGNKLRYVEGYRKCRICGKEKYFYTERNSEAEKKIIKDYPHLYRMELKK